MIAGIDSMVLVYAGWVPSKNPKHSSKYQELNVRAQLLLHKLFREKALVLLPTVAISELLVPVPKTEKGTLIAALTEKFICPSFDVKAAAIAADLWSQHRNMPKDVQYDKRHVLRADVMIVASAYAAGASDFYSHDQKCRDLAKLLMKAHDLPTDDPGDMFLKNDILSGDV
ncbi:MAG: hypothetical protein KKE86_06800 [Planctomycetes bacterium]|nr:hypothetical protein [Planctomycetota bacterium]MBU4399030.1 hypothetical protein [Planctomycetota bacterium]MCG2682998.1 hypothetical protein [Planctomycetales bacterium]